MKTVSKKLFSVMLAVLLLVSAIPFQAFAADIETPGEIDEPSNIPALVPGDPADPPSVIEPIIIPDDLVGGSPASTHDTHTSAGYVVQANGGGTHSLVCSVAGCGTVISTEPCEYMNFDGTYHVCSKCGEKYSIPGHVFTVEVSPAVAVTCTSDGGTATMQCRFCGTRKESEIIHALGHSYDPSTHLCTNVVNGETCGARDPQYPNVVAVTLNAGEGHTFAGGASSQVVNMEVGKLIPSLPTLSDSTGKATFMGWRYGETNVDLTKPYDGSFTVLNAHWVSVTYEVKFYSVLGWNLTSAQYITSVQATPGTRLFNLIENSGILHHEKLIHPGYALESQSYPAKKSNGAYGLTDITTSDVINSSWTVYINLVPDAFKLTLNPNGGSCAISSIPNIAFGNTIALPTPTKAKAVFQGWKDASGNLYKDTLKYTFAEDVTLTAVWSDELQVYLRVYTNGNTTAPVMYELSQLVKGDKVYRTDVESLLRTKYYATSGALAISGLFNEAGWASYCANQNVLGDQFYYVNKENGINYIYVMVKNAVAASTAVTTPATSNPATVIVPNNGNAYWVQTGTNAGYWVYTNTPMASTDPTPNNGNAYWVSTGNGTGYWFFTNGTNPTVPTYIYISGDNPKTGDTAMIEAAAAIMVLAAAALVTVMVMRKKKMF